MKFECSFDRCVPFSVSDSVIARSVQDYYRSYAQRSKWARENLLLDSELSKYDDGLKDRWERKFDAVMDTSDMSTNSGKCEFGRGLCLWACQESIPLRNIVETWITSGSFHGLADILQIGWHPDFKEMFAEPVINDST